MPQLEILTDQERLAIYAQAMLYRRLRELKDGGEGIMAQSVAMNSGCLTEKIFNRYVRSLANSKWHFLASGHASFRFRKASCKAGRSMSHYCANISQSFETT